MARSRITRSTQLASREDVRKQLLKIFDEVQKGFEAQVNRADEICDFWDAYNCRLGGNQFYAGNNQLYVPLLHNAIEARKTRHLNRLFPQAGRNIDVTTEDGTIPHAEMALLEMYVERAALKTKVVPPMLVAGDVEGQITGCVTWSKRTRYTVARETKPLTTGGLEHPGRRPDPGSLRVARVWDALDGDRFTVRAKALVNATGPWSDNVRPPEGGRGHCLVEQRPRRLAVNRPVVGRNADQ